MKRVSLLLALLMMFPIISEAADLGITVFMPVDYEINCASQSSFNQAIFSNAAGRLKLNGNVRITITTSGSNSPPTWIGLSTDVMLARDLFIYCHGSTLGSLFLEKYLDAPYAETAYNAYVATFGGVNITRSVDGKSVGLRSAGIASQLAPNSDSDGNKLVFACDSWTAKDSWGSFDSYNTGGTFFGYPSTVGTDVACQDLDKMLRVMACEGYDSTGLENDILTAYGQTSGQGIFSGNQTNSFNPAMSCKSWDMLLADIQAWNGKLSFVVKNEEAHSQYLIEGVNRIGDAPDSLAVVNGYGTDGSGVFRSYSIPVPQYRHIRLVAYDNSCLTTVSDWIDWGEVKPTLALDPGEELSMLPLKVTANGRISDGRANVMADKSVSPADVVVYTTTDIQVVANRIRASWQITPDANGQNFRAQVWTGSNNSPELAQNLYRDVYDMNRNWNASHPDDQYRDPPILQIVGDALTRVVDGDTIQAGPRPFVWAEGVNGGSGDGIFSSYALMTDVDGDGIPDGPVVAVPANEYMEAQMHADAVEAYNQATFDGGVLLALDDYYSGTASPWVEDKAFGDFSTYVSSRGLNLKGVLKESEWLPSDDPDIYQQMASAGSNIINSGVSEVWYLGMTAASSRHTYFLTGVSDWTTDQGFLLFGPTCDFGDCTWPFGPKAIKVEMFSNSYGGIVVGGIGQLSAGYAHSHMKLSNLMQEMLPQMAEGTLVVDAAFEIQQEFLSRFPELKDYGLGIHCVGSVAKLKSSTASAVGDDLLAAASGFRLRAFRAGSGTGLKFALPRRSEVNLDVYDLRGARVAEIVRGDMLGEGEHSMIWNGRSNGRPVASGTYFARLRVGGENTATVKFAVVK